MSYTMAPGEAFSGSTSTAHALRNRLRVAVWRSVLGTPVGDRILKRRASDLLARVKFGGHVVRSGFYVDIGSGTGHTIDRVLRHHADEGVRLVGLDPAWRPTWQVRRRVRQRWPGRATFVQGDGAALPLADESVDGVTVVFVLHHVPYEIQGPILGEIHRVLRPGGKLFLFEDTPNDQSEWGTHVARDRRLNFEAADEPHFYRSGDEWRAVAAGHGFEMADDVYFEEQVTRPMRCVIRHHAYVLRKR